MKNCFKPNIRPFISTTLQLIVNIKLLQGLNQELFQCKFIS